jgi:hypothetical protein
MLKTHKTFITEHEEKRRWGSINEGIILKGFIHKSYEDVQWIILAEGACFYECYKKTSGSVKGG